MKKILRNLALFLLILFLYYLPGLIWMTDSEYYLSLNIPPYAPSPLVFGITWGVLYLIFSIFLTYLLSKKKITKEVMLSFVINYVISFFFNLVFFKLNNLFLTFSVTVLCAASGLLIFISLLKEKRVYAAFATPYLLWTIFASVLMAHIYFIN